MTKAPLFELSADARFLYQELRKAAVGETINYATLSTKIGKPVVGATSSLRTARRILLRDDGIVFAVVLNTGVKRLSDVDIVALGGAQTASTHRRAKRTALTLAAVADYAAMPPNAQMRHTALVSINAMIADSTRERSIEKVAAAVDGRTQELPIRETLKALGIG